MDDVGTRLRAARERQHLTLEDAALRTRIPRSVLAQIEDNAFERLPGVVFTKGHLRAYATIVGLDAEEIVAEYVMRWPPATTELPVFRRPAVEEQRERGRLVTSTVAIVVVLFAYGALREPGPPGETVTTTPLSAAVVGAGVATQTVADSAVAVVASPERRLRLEVEPTGECWLSAVADGELVVHRLLQEGERTAIDASSELVVRIGDAGAFAYTLNGAPGRSLGDSGMPVTVTITEENHGTFLEGSQTEPLLSAAAAV